MFSFAHCLSLADAVAPQKGRNLLPVRLAVSRFTLPVREKEVLPHIVGSTSFSWTRLNGAGQCRQPEGCEKPSPCGQAAVCSGLRLPIKSTRCTARKAVLKPPKDGPKNYLADCAFN